MWTLRLQSAPDALDLTDPISTIIFNDADPIQSPHLVTGTCHQNHLGIARDQVKHRVQGGQGKEQLIMTLFHFLHGLYKWDSIVEGIHTYI